VPDGHRINVYKIKRTTSSYGESIVKPTIIGIITVGLSTLFWLFQNNPSAEPYIPFVTSSKPHIANTVSNLINVTQILNNTHTLKAPLSSK
jgi:hypothetical protein